MCIGIGTPHILLSKIGVILCVTHAFGTNYEEQKQLQKRVTGVASVCSVAYTRLNHKNRRGVASMVRIGVGSMTFPNANRNSRGMYRMYVVHNI